MISSKYRVGGLEKFPKRVGGDLAGGRVASSARCSYPSGLADFVSSGRVAQRTSTTSRSIEPIRIIDRDLSVEVAEDLVSL